MTNLSEAPTKHVLVVGVEQIAALTGLALKAGRNPLVIADIIGVPDRVLAYRQTAMAQTIAIPDGYTVTLTVEDHNGTWFRHLSIAVDAPDLLPGRTAVELIARHCGFLGNAGHWRIHVENLVAHQHAALNAMQEVKHGQAIAPPPTASLHS